jgi:hypothetical protein
MLGAWYGQQVSPINQFCQNWDNSGGFLFYFIETLDFIVFNGFC